MSAAARALGGVRDERVLPLLIKLARRQPLIGVMEALGKFRCPEAIPALIRGLDEDYSRPAAETALRGLGRRSRYALLRLATMAGANIRARRSAMALLVDMGIAPWQRAAVRGIVWDDDPIVSVHASAAYLGSGAPEDGQAVIARLVEILPQLRGAVRLDAVECLRVYAQFAPDLAQKALQPTSPSTETRPAPARARRPVLQLPWRHADP